jgi:hypothetical protein
MSDISQYISADETDLKASIIALSSTITTKKNQLFIGRLLKMINPSLYSNVKSINILPTNLDNEDWNITYVHETSNYDLNNYAKEDNHESTDTSKDHKVSNISFGKAGKRYYIKGGIRFNIYRNSKGKLRITNPDYDFDIDMEDHEALIFDYSRNKDIPEAAALSVFLYLSDNRWVDIDLINYLSIV